MRRLPAEWEWAEFKDVATVESNLVDPADYPDYPHIAPNHIESRTGRLLAHTTVRADGVTSSKHLFFPGHILYSKIRPYLAKAVRVDFEGLCSADMYPISTRLNTRFLLHWLLSSEFTALAAGEQGRSVLPKINREALDRLPVPVPPLREQERIVSELEADLTRLDAAEAGLRVLRPKLDRFEEVLLRDAFDLAWERVPITALTDPARVIRYGILKPGDDVPGGIPVVKVRDYPLGEIQVASLKRTSPAIADRFKGATLRSGDVLISIRGTYGRVAAVPDDLDGANITQDSARIAPLPLLHRGFLVHFLRSPECQTFLRRVARGVAVKGVNIRDLRELRVPLPDVDTQARTAALLDDQLSLHSHLGGEVEKAGKGSHALRRSLLGAAFSGQLVRQDPDDERASVLLARMRADRTATIPSSRARKAAAR
jgi:type I restriction enzyme S subunit